MANDERCNVIETQLLDFSFIYGSYVLSKRSQRYHSINNKHEASIMKPPTPAPPAPATTTATTTSYGSLRLILAG